MMNVANNVGDLIENTPLIKLNRIGRDCAGVLMGISALQLMIHYLLNKLR